MKDPIELTPELLAALKAQASEWDRGSLKINTMPFDPRVVLALIEDYETNHPAPVIIDPSEWVTGRINPEYRTWYNNLSPRGVWTLDITKPMWIKVASGYENAGEVFLWVQDQPPGATEYRGVNIPKRFIEMTEARKADGA